MLVLLAALASAGCPWEARDASTVSADMTSVSVAGRRYDVRGPAAREEFAGLLHACELGAAVQPFEAWRRARRATNAWAVVGVAVGAVGALPVVITAPKAGRERVALVNAIRWSAAHGDTQRGQAGPSGSGRSSD